MLYIDFKIISLPLLWYAFICKLLWFNLVRDDIML